MALNLSNTYLPCDPKDSFYLTTCFVCQDEAKMGHVHIRHYGGVVCFSCRQFFRRAHQQSKQPNFVCNKDNACLVTTKTRRKCQKCRYVRCRMAGMDPDAVLTVDQKKVRFQKFLRKKRKRNLMSMSLTIDDDDEHSDISSHENQLSPLRHDEDNYFSSLSNGGGVSPNKISRYEHNNLREQQQHQQQYLPLPRYYEQPQLIFPPEVIIHVPSGPIYFNESMDWKSNIVYSPSPKTEQWNPNLTGKVETILRTFQMSLGELKNTDFHSNYTRTKDISQFCILTNKEEILSHLMDVAMQFQQFALLQSQFFKMKGKNQQLLLSRNAPLFLQLHLAYHFGKLFGFDIKTNNDFYCKQYSAKLQWFNSISHLFERSADLQYYSELLAELHSYIRLSSSKARAVLAYVITFNFDQEMRLSDTFILEDISILNDILFDNCLKQRDSKLHLAGLISILRKMVRFSNACIIWNGLELSSFREAKFPLIRQCHVTYTTEERCWLRNKLDCVKDALRYSCMDDNLIREFLMISLGVPPSEPFTPTCARLILDKVWRVLSIHTEFQDLRVMDQRAVFGIVGPLGFALIVAKQENNTCAMTQLKEDFCEMDIDQLKQSCVSLFKCQSKVKKMWCLLGFLQEWHKPRSKVSPSTTLQTLKNKLTPMDLTTYFRAVSDLRPILQDQFLYKMTMLLTLTFFCPSLTDTYTKMIWSHLVSCKRTSKQTNEIMSAIHNSLLPICRMSKVLMKMAIV